MILSSYEALNYYGPFHSNILASHLCAERHFLFCSNENKLSILQIESSTLDLLDTKSVLSDEQIPLRIPLGGAEGNFYEDEGLLAFTASQDGELLITAGRSYIIRLWKLTYGAPYGTEESQEKFNKLTISAEMINHWKGPNSYIRAICINNSSSIIASGSVNGNIRIDFIDNSQTSYNFTSHSSRITQIKFHHSQKHLLFSGCEGGKLFMWNVLESQCVTTYEDHLSSIISMQTISLNVQNSSLGALITAGRDKILNIWDLGIHTYTPKNSKLHTLKPLQQLILEDEIESLICLPYSTVNNAISSTKSPKRQKKSEGDTPPSWVILITGEKGTISIINPINKSIMKTIDTCHVNSGGISQIHCVENSTLLAIGVDLNISIISLPHFKTHYQFLGKLEDIIHCDFIPPSNKADTPSQMTLLNGDKNVYVMSLSHGPCALPFVGHTDIVLCTHTSPCGKFLLTGSKDETIRLWEKESQICLAKLAGHIGPVTGVIFESFQKENSNSPHTLTLFSIGQDLSIKYWSVKLQQNFKDIQTINRSTRSISAHTKDINDIDISLPTHEKMIATASQDRSIKLWKAHNLELIGVLKGHQRGVWCVRFSPVEQVLASTSADMTIKIWNVHTFECLKTFQGHTGAVLQAIFIKQGMQLASCGSDGLIKVWTIRSSECTQTIEKHDDKVWCLSAYDKYLLSGGADGKVYFWKDISDIMIEESKGKYTDALKLSLDLQRPNQCRMLFETIVKKDLMNSIERNLEFPPNSVCVQDNHSTKSPIENGINTNTYEDAPNNNTDEHDHNHHNTTEQDNILTKHDNTHTHINQTDLSVWVKSLSSTQLIQLFKFALGWNAVSKHSWLASSLMILLLSHMSIEELSAIEGFYQLAGSLVHTSTRHEARVGVLLQKSFLLDMLLGTHHEENANVSPKDVLRNRNITYKHLYN